MFENLVELYQLEIDDTRRDDDIETFVPVVQAIKFDQLLAVALKARFKHRKIDPKISCSIEKIPIFGSYYFICFVVFSDGLKWVAKIPRYGIARSFNKNSRVKMVSEILTLRMIRLKTQIPVPHIYVWDTTPKKIGVPFVLMSCIMGRPVVSRWFDKSWITEEKRLTILRNLAEIMSSLHRLHFDKIGALTFDERGKFLNVDSLIVQTEGDIFHPEYELINGHRTVKWPEPTVIGPFHTAKEYLSEGIEALAFEIGLSSVAAKHRRADVAILRLAIESIPANLMRDGSFVLSHPSFDSSNVFIDDGGQITGLLDWDGVHTMPRGYGFSCFPSWITRDWDPIMYGYKQGDCEEDSPQQLSQYRKFYTSVFANLDLPSADYTPNDTRLSHIYEAIFIASCGYWNLGPIDRILEHAFYSSKEQPFNAIELRRSLIEELDNRKGYGMVELIREAFRHMWHPEWES